MSTETAGDTTPRDLALLGQTVVVIGGSAGIAWRPRASHAPREPR
jgi:hypothetical protein